MDTTSSVLQRKNVNSKLLEAIATHPLVVLTAPIGYGKSTAAKEVSLTTHLRSLYVALPSGEHSPEFVWNVLCNQLASQHQELAQTMLGIGPPLTEALLVWAVSLWREYTQQESLLLIVDNFQYGNIAEINLFIETLVRLSLPKLHILIATRTRPDIHLAELRLKGLAAVFNQELLLFSREETEQLYRLYGVEDMQAAERTWVCSEGWAAAIWICLRNHLAGDTREPFVQMERFINESLFANCPEETQRLLLQIAVLKTFTPAQVAYISEDITAQQRLYKLHEDNLLISYNPSSDSYRLQGIFRAFLLHQLEENTLNASKSINKQRLYSRTAETHMVDGNYMEAIRLFHRSGLDTDKLRILKIFENPDEALVINFDLAETTEIMQAIPWSVRCLCPMGYLSFIHCCIARAGLETGRALLEEAESHFASEPGIAPLMRQKIQGEIEMTHASMSFNDLETMCAQYEKSYNLLQGRSSIMSQHMTWTFDCPHAAFLYLRTQGTYKKLVSLVEKKIHFYQSISGGSSPGAQDLFRAEHYLETGDIHAVKHPLLKAERKVQTKEHFFSLLAAAFTESRMYIARGKIDKAWEKLDDTARILKTNDNPLLLFNLDLCRGYIAAVLKRPERIPGWLKSGDMPKVPGFYQTSIFPLIVQGKVYTALRDWASMEILMERAETQLASYNSLLGRIHIMIFKTLTAMHVQNSMKALNYLLPILELARHDRLITSIAEYGIHLNALIHHLQELHPEDNFLIILAKHTKKYAKMNKSQTIPLTLREQDLLSHAANGESNRTIAEQLGISKGSVANALTRIYVKLGVNNRVEALKILREDAMRDDNTSTPEIKNLKK